MMGNPRYQLRSVSPLPQKEKKESENHVVTLDWGSWGLTSKGLPKAATTPGVTTEINMPWGWKVTKAERNRAALK